MARKADLNMSPVGQAHMRSKSFVPVPGTAVVLISTAAVTSSAPGESAVLYGTVMRLLTPPKNAEPPEKSTFSATPS